MTIAELRSKLSVIEPTESLYAGLVPSDVPLLAELIGDHEEWLAARAVCALGRLATAEAVGVLAAAVSDKRSAVRAAVASTVGQRSLQLPDRAVVTLLQDTEASVRKFAVSTVQREHVAATRAYLSRLAASDQVDVVRQHAAAALRRVER